jgi:hypothetical protein
VCCGKQHACTSIVPLEPNQNGCNEGRQRPTNKSGWYSFSLPSYGSCNHKGGRLVALIGFCLGVVIAMLVVVFCAGVVVTSASLARTRIWTLSERALLSYFTHQVCQ